MSVKNRERDVEAYLSKKLSKLNMHCYKIIPDNRVGMPDRIVTLPDGRCVWVELKTDNGKLSVVQQLRHAELKKAGQQVEVVWSKEDADRFVDHVTEIVTGEEARRSVGNNLIS